MLTYTDILIVFDLMTMLLITIVTSCLSLYSNPHPHPAEIDSGPPVPLAYFRPWLSPKNTDAQYEINSNSLHIWYLSQVLISMAKKKIVESICYTSWILKNERGLFWTWLVCVARSCCRGGRGSWEGRGLTSKAGSWRKTNTRLRIKNTKSRFLFFFFTSM